MEFLIVLLGIAVPTLAAVVVLRRRMENLKVRPYREGEVRPWELDAEQRAERRRANVLLEEELMRRAA